MNWFNVYLTIFLFSMLITLIFTPLFRKFALKIGFTDKPKSEDHKSHNEPIPLLGGVAICFSWMVVILIGVFSPYILKNKFYIFIINGLSANSEVMPRLFVIILGGIAFSILGFLDDRYSLRAKYKFFAQVVVVLFAVYYGGIRISVFDFSPFVGFIFTCLWMLVIINAINFFDNMDGLAIGIAAIAFAFLGVVSIILKHYLVACFSLVSLGVSMGFWFYNHYPASIFMGDSGSHFIGYLLGVLSSITTYYKHTITSTYLSIFIPLFILAIPLFDLVAVIIIRLRIGRPIYVGDNNHISHRFCKMGLSRKNAVFAVHLLAIIIGLSVLPSIWGDFATAIICFIQGSLLLIFISSIQYHLIRDQIYNVDARDNCSSKSYNDKNSK